MSAAPSETERLRTSLKTLIDAANPALLAGLSGMVLGEAYTDSLKTALIDAKTTLAEGAK